MSKVWVVSLYDMEEMERSTIGVFSTLDKAKAVVLEGLTSEFDEINEDIFEAEEGFDYEDAEEDEQDCQDEYLESLKIRLGAVDEIRKNLMDPLCYSIGNYFQLGLYEITEFEIDKQ